MISTHSESSAVLPQNSLAPLESVLCTEELNRRPSRPANYEKENRALVFLAKSLADSPRSILQTLAEKILEVFQVGSAGISLLTKDDGGKRFYWPAIAGIWKPHIGGGTPRDFGPCGDVLDCNGPLMFTHPERRYAYFLPVKPAVEECLLVPFYVEGKAVGTIWVIAHDNHRKFDSEDLRLLDSLGQFASAAYQTVEFLHALEQQGEALRQSHAELQKVYKEAHDSRRAALNLMEDAIQSREEMETLNTTQRESEERYRTLFTSAPMAVFVCDRSAVIQQYNQHAVELWGREPECGVERHCGSVKLWRPDGTQLPHDQSPMVEVLRTGVSALNVEVSMERPDGSRLPVLVNFAALKNAEGEIIGAVTSFMDITEQKQAEDALRAAGERKSEFLAILAHELRNPLAPIRNALQVIRLTDDISESVKSASEMMERQVGQMVRLIDDLLDVSRFSRGTITLRRGRIELASVVHHAVEACRPAVEAAEQELVVTLPEAPIYLDADPTRLAQVAGNLLTNACKFTDQGGRIWLTAEREGEEAVLRVRDSGIGIASEQLPRIFEMFGQVDNSLERTQSGLGIGLSLVKNLVELHGGTVEALSEGVGQGSEFVVRLPVLTEAPETLPSPTASELPAATPRRILVVDDNRDSAATLAMLMQLSGNETHTAYDGQEAVEAAAAFRPDVMLLDIGLPKLNGYDVARRIREEPWGKKMVIVALSGWGQEEDRLHSKEAGFNGHLVKPVDHDALSRLLAGAPPGSV